MRNSHPVPCPVDRASRRQRRQRRNQVYDLYPVMYFHGDGHLQQLRPALSRSITGAAATMRLRMRMPRLDES